MALKTARHRPVRHERHRTCAPPGELVAHIGNQGNDHRDRRAGHASVCFFGVVLALHALAPHLPVDMNNEPFSLNSWLNEDLYGFVERNDPLPADKSLVVFDMVRASDADALLGPVALRSDDLVQQLAALPGLLAVAEVPSPKENGDGGGLAEGSWQGVRLGSGRPAEAYPELDAVPVQTRLTHSTLTQAKSSALGSAFTISGLPKATRADLARLLPGSIDHVSVYNVGQGNCSALCVGEAPVLYFDTGGGCLQNTKTYPTVLDFCVSHAPPVVLSHWDFDHWFSAYKVAALRSLEWLVPDQGSVGRRTLAFAQTLPNARLWPGRSHTFGAGTIVQCTGKTRNDSGLALFAGTTAGSVLLPADAEFGFIPVPSGTRALAGLVATHHGSRHVGSPVPKPASGAKLAYSFGNGNTFGHPTVAAVARYQAEGWLLADTRESPYGHIWLGPGNATLPCGGRNCHLQTVQ
jgi:beta-lactamase superfamily II metal-dependent hydrolase